MQHLQTDANDEFGLAHLTLLALAAGDEIMRHFPLQTPAAHKADGSPVTPADVAAEAIILNGLQRHFDGIACVAEEAVSAGNCPHEVGRTFFLIDALDGTREFLAGRDEFTVNIAVVRDRMPALGVVYAPARHLLYTGVVAQRRARRHVGRDACSRAAHAAMSVIDGVARGTAPNEPECTPIAVRALAMPPSIVASRSRCSDETRAFIQRFPGAHVEGVGSSLKFCAIAAGDADFYPCFGRTMEWDTAAGQAVLMAAGGQVTQHNGEALAYGKRGQADADYANPWFVASGSDTSPISATPSSTMPPACDLPASG